MFCLTLRLHELQHSRLPYPSLSPWVCSNSWVHQMDSCLSSWWYYLTILSSAIPFSFCLQSFPASGSFAVSWFFTSVQLLSHVWLFVTPWTAACQASLSITNPRSLPKLVSIELVMPSNRLILCCPLLCLPSVLSSIRVFSSKSALHIRWPKYWSFSFSTSPTSEYSRLISSRID